MTLDSYIKHVNGRYYKPEVGDKMAKEMGSRAASQAVPARAPGEGEGATAADEGDALGAVGAGTTEKVMEGIGAAVDSLLPDTPTQLLGTTSADNSPLDNFSWSWQCDGQNDHDGGVVVVYLAPSVNFQCVFKHSCEGGGGSTTLLGRAAVARTAEVTKFEEDQRTIGRLERPRGYEAVLAQRTIDRPTPKAPSTSSREIETLRDARGRERPAAEVYDEWTGGRVALRDVPAVVLARGPDGVDGVNILQASSRFPLLVTKPGGEAVPRPPVDGRQGAPPPLLRERRGGRHGRGPRDERRRAAHPGRDDQRGSQGGDRARRAAVGQAAGGDGIALLLLRRIEDRRLPRRRPQGRAGAGVRRGGPGQERPDRFRRVLFARPPHRTAPPPHHRRLRRRFDEVDADKGGTIDAAEFEDPITHPADAMLSAFGAATQRMPFALVHPFGEQGGASTAAAAATRRSEAAALELSFGALIFFTDSKDVRKAVSDVPSQDRIPAKEVWAAIEREKRDVLRSTSSRPSAC